MKAIFTVGVSASGKTTWAESQVGYVNINRDDIRFQHICNGIRSWRLYKFNKANEQKVTAIQTAMLADAIAQGKDVIISDTNLNPKNYRWMHQALENAGYEIEFKFFPISYEEALKRDSNRDNPVGQQVIARQFEQWNKLYGDKVDNDPSLPKCIIVDVDGTLAEMKDRGPFEWDKVGNDLPRQNVIDVVNAIAATGATVIVFSGRDSVCYNETAQWLTDKGVNWSGLMMRPQGDMRKDSVIKRELFDKHVAGKYYVTAVFDDRPQVVRLWQEMGLTVFALGNQHVDF